MQRNLYLCVLLSFSFMLFTPELSGQNQTPKKNSKAKTYKFSEDDEEVLLNSYNRLAKRPYVYVKPYYFRAYNSEDEYIVLQLGKRKRNKIFLFVKIFVHNPCVEDKDIVEFTFNDGSIKALPKNNYPVNCDGVIVKKLTRKEQEKLISSRIKSFMLFTFEKDYIFHLKEETAINIQENLKSLKNYKFR